MKIWQLFLTFYLSRQKDCVNSSIPVSAYLKIVVCNRLILTQTDCGHPFRGVRPHFSARYFMNASARLCVNLRFTSVPPAAITMPFDSHFVISKRFENLSKFTNFGEECRVDCRTALLEKVSTKSDECAPFSERPVSASGTAVACFKNLGFNGFNLFPLFNCSHQMLVALPPRFRWRERNFHLQSLVSHLRAAFLPVCKAQE